MEIIRDIKILLDAYERFIDDWNGINEASISQTLKEQVVAELENRAVSLKKEILLKVYNMDGPKVSFGPVDRALAIVDVPSVVTESVEEVAVQSFSDWKQWTYKQVEIIYNHDVRYSTSKSVLKDIYEYMASVYSVCWKEENRDWRQQNSAAVNTLNVIYSKAKLRNLFESILEGRVDKTVLEHPEKVSLVEVITPLMQYYGDHADTDQVLRLVYEDMGARFNIGWDRCKKRYMRMNSVKGVRRADLIIWDQKLYEQFRESASILTEERRNQKQTA